MSDIFGRSTIAPTNVITKKQISSMIRKYVTSGLNLVNVDPGEIVVFGDKQGKLKTSDISLDSLLTIPKDAADDSIAVFKQNKITAGDKLSSIINSIIELRNDFFAHVTNYATLRRNFNTTDNTIEKFFGKKNIKPDEVTTTLPDLKKSIEDIKKVTDVNSITTIKQDIASINYRLDLTIDAVNAINKKLIEEFKPIIDKVRIPHEVNNVKNIVYTVWNGISDFVQGTGLSHNYVFFPPERTNGIYRFSLISEYQFNIKFQAYNKKSGELIILGQGVNTILINQKEDYERYSFDITPVDSAVVRARVYYILEFIYY